MALAIDRVTEHNGPLEVPASAGTHLAAEAMVMEEAILLTGESSECCDGR